MTRSDAERLISEKLIEIYNIVKDFDSEEYYLSLCVNNCNDGDYDTFLYFNNTYWEKTDDKKIDASIWMKGGEIVDSTIKRNP